MADDYLSADGIIVPPGGLELGRARQLADMAGGGAVPFVRLIECRRETGTDGSVAESVVIELDVERPQAPLHDIRRRERIAAVFKSADRSYPEALALRPDFPLVPHINHTWREFPRSLCLYDRPWAEVAIRWTPVAFVERIRNWLKLTAKGMLHQDDQPLEQLLFDTGLRLILPSELLEDLTSDAPVRLDVFRVGDAEYVRNLIAVKPPVEKEGKKGPLDFVATTFSAKPQTHGIIRQTPSTLCELHDLVATGGIDLIGELRRRLRDWEESRLRAARLVIIVAFPLTRTDSGATEEWDFWAFLTARTVREVGVAIGLWGESNGHVALLLHFDETKRGQDISIGVVAPYLEFSRTAAAAANSTKPNALKVVAVGAGALGSQLIATLARSGFGTWTIVDGDDLLPHNLARHALSGGLVGFPKAEGLAFHLTGLYRESTLPEGIVADVLSPGETQASLGVKYKDAELLLDMAASVPVARHLALDIISPARRVSVFLNPTGTDVVVIAEDAGRSHTLDALEAQYYRAAATAPELVGHLSAAPGRVRYGRSCRDITAAIPTHLVGMHAAIASQAVRHAIASSEASVRVWRCDVDSMAVTPVKVEVAAAAARHEVCGWTIVLDEYVRARLVTLRASKLPNETGGVLIGTYDLTRRIVYVVDTIPSPPDSAEWPTLYIRGSEGLLDQVRAFESSSAGQLEYVGEWHSHPDGCPPLPSADDLQVFAWLTDHMSNAGLPALMAIVGQGESSVWFLGKILPDTAWRFEC